MVLDAAKKHEGEIYTYGPLIHNPCVLDILREKGVQILEEIPEEGTGTVIIRAHGVPPDVSLRLENAGFSVIDATCPRVIKVQTIIRKHASRGYASVIVGDQDHPEVIGLMGYAQGRGVVVGKSNSLSDLPLFEKAIVVAQTTQNTKFYQDVKSWFRENRPGYRIFDTICDSTEMRQAEVQKLSKEVDALIVVGGYTSGNTQRLFEIAKRSGKPAFHVESEAQLDLEGLSGCKSVGITAGASTPAWGIRGVYRSMETMPLKFGRQFSKLIIAVQRAVLFSSLYLAVGAGALCYACTKLQGLDGFFPHGLLAFFYVLSMHIFNNLTGRRADRYNDPEKALFYDRKKTLLLIVASVGIIGGLAASITLGAVAFFLFFLMSAAGLLYNIRFVPPGLFDIDAERLKDIPASKTVLIALGWGIAASFFAPLERYGTITLASVAAFLWSVGFVFVRTAFFDILDMHGDRLVGRETLPIVLGEKRTFAILKIVSGALFLFATAASASGVFATLGYRLSLCPLLFLVLIVLCEKGCLIPSLRLELLIESNFILAGLVALTISVF